MPWEREFFAALERTLPGVQDWYHADPDGTLWMIASYDLVEDNAVHGTLRVDWDGRTLRGGFSPSCLNWDDGVRAEDALIDSAAPHGLHVDGVDPAAAAEATAAWMSRHVRDWLAARKSLRAPGRVTVLFFICSSSGVTVAESILELEAYETGSMFFQRRVGRYLRRRGRQAPAWVTETDRVFTADGRVVRVEWPEGADGPTATVTDDTDEAALDAALTRQAAAWGLPPPTASGRVAFAEELRRRQPRESVIRLLLTEPFRRLAGRRRGPGRGSGAPPDR
jgi:hypothetical protein